MYIAVSNSAYIVRKSCCPSLSLRVSSYGLYKSICGRLWISSRVVGISGAEN